MEVLNRQQVINETPSSNLIKWWSMERDRGWKSKYMISLPSKLIRNKSETIEWLESNITGRWNIIWSFWLEFENEIDVVAFKLRWM